MTGMRILAPCLAHSDTPVGMLGAHYNLERAEVEVLTWPFLGGFGGAMAFADIEWLLSKTFLSS